MELKDYLTKHGLIVKRFGEKIGISPQMMCLLCKKAHDIHLSTAMKIVKATNGEVTYEDLVKNKDLKNLVK